MNIKLKSLKSINLKKNELSQIFKLKNSHWKTSINEQKNGLKKISTQMIFIILFT